LVNVSDPTTDRISTSDKRKYNSDKRKELQGDGATAGVRADSDDDDVDV